MRQLENKHDNESATVPLLCSDIAISNSPYPLYIGTGGSMLLVCVQAMKKLFFIAYFFLRLEIYTFLQCEKREAAITTCMRQGHLGDFVTYRKV